MPTQYTLAVTTPLPARPRPVAGITRRRCWARPRAASTQVYTSLHKFTTVKGTARFDWCPHSCSSGDEAGNGSGSPCRRRDTPPLMCGASGSAVSRSGSSVPGLSSGLSSGGFSGGPSSSDGAAAEPSATEHLPVRGGPEDVCRPPGGGSISVAAVAPGWVLYSCAGGKVGR